MEHSLIFAAKDENGTVNQCKIKLTTLSVIVKDKSASMNMLICNGYLTFFICLKATRVL